MYRCTNTDAGTTSVAMDITTEGTGMPTGGIGGGSTYRAGNFREGSMLGNGK
jgi:hypothetical protein